jgi:hypothetical protein
MKMETLISLAALVAVASAAFVCVWLVCKRLQTVRSSYMLAAALWGAALASMWFIDTNVPLHSSHYRPGGEAAPTWLALLAFFVRSAAFASIAVAASRHRSAQASNKRVQPTLGNPRA